MQFNLKSVLIGGAIAGTLIGLPLIAKAQMPRLMSGLTPPIVQELNLNTEQQSELQTIRQNTRTQIQNLLTPEQRQAWQTAMQQGMLPDLNLSAEQKVQRREIFRTARDQMKAVLTSEQQQKFRDLVRSHWLNGQMGELSPELQQRLNLTEDQKTQLNQLRQSARTQVETILTPEQRQQLETALSKGEGFLEIFESLDDGQRAQLRALLRSSRQDMAAVLTADQQQELRSFLRDSFGRAR